MGGMILLVAYALSPNALAHGRLITSDLAFVLMLTVALAAVWMTLHRISVSRVALCCTATGLLFLTKTSAVLILPMAALLVAIRLLLGPPLKIRLPRLHRDIRDRVDMMQWFALITVVSGFTTWGLIWTSYGFRYESGADNPMVFAWREVLTPYSFPMACVELFRDYRLLPDSYLFGMAHVLHFSQERAASFFGEYRTEGWRSFFPIAYLIKTPLATHGLAILAAGAGIAAFRPWPAGLSTARSSLPARPGRLLYQRNGIVQRPQSHPGGTRLVERGARSILPVSPRAGGATIRRGCGRSRNISTTCWQTRQRALVSRADRVR
ncbi:hypothetical protein OAS39_06125 [Pirellulales bacterium]|nr:hypothetical protein [Pirellulales bacterium]